MTPKAFAARLRELRRRRGWTQEELADQTGLSADTIRRLERGKNNPSLDTITKIANGLQLTVAAVINDRFDEVDELAVFIRQLPVLHQRIAFAVIYSLHHDKLSSS